MFQRILAFGNLLRVLIREGVEAGCVELAEEVLDDVFMAEVQGQTEKVFVDDFAVHVSQIDRSHQASL